VHFAASGDTMNMIFFGPPGSGKGTQAKVVAQKLQLEHISTGEIFRQNIGGNTPLGKACKEYLDSGRLVPDELTVEMVKRRIEQCRGGFLLDGFPRSLGQAKALDEFASIDRVILITLSDSEVVLRITGRRTCPCGEFYNVNVAALKPEQEGICDKCGERLVQRSDDTEATVRARLAVYHKETEPALSYYRAKGLVNEIDGSMSVDEVTRAIMALF
jgi:adenylate kinase